MQSVFLRLSQPDKWEAQLGLHVQRNIGPNVQKRTLKQIIAHPNYNSFTFDNDIALMELSSPVTYSDYIRPICLPAPQHDFPVGNTVWITGWGATREGGECPQTRHKYWGIIWAGINNQLKYLVWEVVIANITADAIVSPRSQLEMYILTPKLKSILKSSMKNICRLCRFVIHLGKKHKASVLQMMILFFCFFFLLGCHIISLSLSYLSCR